MALKLMMSLVYLYTGNFYVYVLHQLQLQLQLLLQLIHQLHLHQSHHKIQAVTQLPENGLQDMSS